MVCEFSRRLPISPSKSPKTYLDRYFESANDENHLRLAAQLGETSTKLSKTIVMIPVAAHQDAGRIVPALEQYARQETDKPFTIVLHLNNPAHSMARDQTERAKNEVERAKSLYPDLDIRSCHMEYDSPKIGKIRADLWRSVMHLAEIEGKFQTGQPISLGINHDIDVDYIHSQYISRIQKYYQKLQLDLGNYQILPTSVSMVSHTLPHQTHPNIARVIGWSDLASRQSRDVSGYEAGVICPLKTYALRGGFNENDETYETRRLAGHNLHGAIPGTFLRTSPRRYIDRLHAAAPTEIWHEGTFTHTDSCRNVRWQPDISSKRADNLLTAIVPGNIKNSYIGSAERVALAQYINLRRLTSGTGDPDLAFDILEKHMAHEIRIRLAIAKRALKTIAQLPYADTFFVGYDPGVLAKCRTDNLRVQIQKGYTKNNVS